MLNINTIDISATVASLLEEEGDGLTYSEDMPINFVFSLEYDSVLYTTNYTVYNSSSALQDGVNIYYTDHTGTQQSDITDVNGEASLDNFKEGETYIVKFNLNGDITRVEQVYNVGDLTDGIANATITLIEGGSNKEETETMNLDYIFNLEYEEVVV